MDPRIRIHTKLSWIRNTDRMHLNFHLTVINVDAIALSVPEPHHPPVSPLTSSSSRKLFICVVAFQAQVTIGDTVNITITDAVYHGRGHFSILSDFVQAP
jgi:hypothetical protein